MELEHMEKDVQELMEIGIDVGKLKNKTTFLVDRIGRRWIYVDSYLNPVGVEVLTFKTFSLF